MDNTHEDCDRIKVIFSARKKNRVTGGGEVFLDGRRAGKMS